jgi:hypothetical protein
MDRVFIGRDSCPLPVLHRTFVESDFALAVKSLY